MRKKTKRGGASILEKIPYIKNVNKKGIYIADDINYNIRQGKKEDLIKKYEYNLNEAKENVKRAKDEKYRDIEEEKIQNERDKATIEERKLRNNKIQFAINTFINIFIYFIDLIYKLLLLVGGFLTNFFNISIKVFPILGNGLKNIVNVGKGVIIKTLVLIAIIIAIFFGYNAIVHNKDPSKVNEMISTDESYSSFLINTKTPNIFGDYANSFYNIIPDKYKIQFNFFKNRFNSIIGNDIYESVGTSRPQITIGKNDGIYHIKKENDNDYTYTTLKPKDIEIDITSINPNCDYYKLPENIKNLYQNINGVIILPVDRYTQDPENAIFPNAIWKYDADNLRYKGDALSLKNRQIVLPFVNTSNLNEFKFNKQKAKIFNDDDKRAGTILSKMFNYNDSKYKYPF